MADNFFVTAVIVTHDGSTWLTESIAAIFSQSRPVDRIIAVDTGSLDNSVKLLNGSGIQVIEAPRDHGFGESINLALDNAIPVADTASELLWILHDDCAPTRNTLELLIAQLEDRPQIAAAGPKIRGWGNRNQLREVGISIARNGARWTGLEKGEQDQGQHDGVREVLAVSTAAMLVRRSVFTDMGGFDLNLDLFRDDVDFGWRARVAGFTVVAVPEALIFHAEASAKERRVVDVHEAFLHRPLLLDRRNAAYVILANLPWWQLPGATIQILASALLRSIIYLLAKLPGYALDEFIAVGYLFIKPGELITARRARKKSRLLPSQVIKPFIPPRGSQIRHAFERIGSAISERFNPITDESEEINSEVTFADLGLAEEALEEVDFTTVTKRSSRLQRVANRPLLAALTLIFLVTTLASRNRFGALSGGAMPLAPGSGLDAIRTYAESWHLVAMGSGAPAPTWLAITGFLSFVTLANLTFFISALFWATPIVALFAMYRALKRMGLTSTTAVVGGLIYSLSPVVWNSINQGRLGTIAVALTAPLFISLAPLKAIESKASWRRIYSLALLAAFISAFAADLLLIWTLLILAWMIEELLSRRGEISVLGATKFAVTSDLDTLKRKFAFLVIPLLLNFPWSATLVLHPTQFLNAPGLPMSGGSAWSAFTFNSGGTGAVPTWIIAPYIAYLLIALYSLKTRTFGAVALGLFAIVILFAQAHITGHGSIGLFWPGDIFIVVEIFLITKVLELGHYSLPRLRATHIGWDHAVAAGAAILTIFSISTTSVWALTGGANSPVTSNHPQVIPAFIASLTQTPARPKTLVLKKSGSEIQYFVSRGVDLSLGDPDVAVPVPPQLDLAISDMVTGSGVSSSKVLGAYGISYLYIQLPADQSLIRTIDGIGGFTRSASGNSGIVWKVMGSDSRIVEKLSNGATIPINSSDVGGQGEITAPGSILLAEKFDKGWKLLANGVPVPVEHSSYGVPVFKVSQPGPVTLLHDGTLRRGLLSFQLLCLLTVIVLALPAGRRRSEVAAGEGE